MIKQLYKVLKIIFILFFTIQIQAQINTSQESDSLFSKTFQETKNFWVQLPENYNPNSPQKYPVVFILDGGVMLNTLKTVYNNYWGHYLPHMILVGIPNSTNRTRDLTTSQIKMRRGAEFDQDTGGAEKFTQYITKELIPYIDNAYPTTSYRTLIGHSYAGLFTINMLINHNSFFKNYIAIDPSLDWDSQKLLKQAKQKLVSENFKGNCLFVSMAAEQLHMMDESVTINNLMENTSEFTLFPRSIMEFSNFAESHKDNGLNFSWKIYPEDLHGTVPLPSIRDGLVYLFNWFQFKNPPKYNNPETTVEELEQLLNEQEKIYLENYGYSVPPMVEELFIGYGYMNIQMGAPKKAKLFFTKATKYYPKSANAFDSLAEYYEAQEDYPNAIKNMKKAYDLSGNKVYKQRLENLQEKN